MNKQEGFTLIEIAVAITVISLLAAVAVPAYKNYVLKSKFAEVILQTAAIKESVSLCLKEYKQPVGCTGGSNGVLTDTTAINKTKYTLSVITVDGVITATARGADDSAAIAAAGGGGYDSVAPLSTVNYNDWIFNKNASTPTALCAASFAVLVKQGIAGSGQYQYSMNTPAPGRTQAMSGTCGIKRNDGGGGVSASWQITTANPVCPTPTSGAAYTFYKSTGMCERLQQAPASYGLKNETYILTPTLNADSSIVWYVAGSCISAKLCNP